MPTPCRSFQEPPGEELAQVRTIHGANMRRPTQALLCPVRAILREGGLGRLALKFVYLLNFVYKQILKHVGSNVNRFV